jgi:serine/threonine-protein kinase RsbT
VIRTARRVRLTGELDVADAARAARELAEGVGLSSVEAQHLATAVSEVATNALKYAGGGDVELAADEDGRRGVRVVVRDDGPGIADLAAALRDGTSTGGSLGLGLPGARRLTDAFDIESRPGHGTVVRMARWAGGAARDAPVSCSVEAGPGGVALAQPYRNGILLAVAAGPRAARVVRAWRTRPWQAPGRLAEACLGSLDAGERLGLALAAFNELDGRLEWLSAGAVGAGLVRGKTVVAQPRGGRALTAGIRVPPTGIVDVRRDDVLVLAAAPLEPEALLVRARTQPGPDAPAGLVARFARGALERHARRGSEAPHRRRTDPPAGSTLEKP